MDACPEHLECWLRDVRADYLEPPLLEEPRERALSSPDVQDLRAGVSGEQYVEQKALSELVPGADEVRRRAPRVWC